MLAIDDLYDLTLESKKYQRFKFIIGLIKWRLNEVIKIIDSL